MVHVSQQDPSALVVAVEGGVEWRPASTWGRDSSREMYGSSSSSKGSSSSRARERELYCFAWAVVKAPYAGESTCTNVTICEGRLAIPTP